MAYIDKQNALQTTHSRGITAYTYTYTHTDIHIHTTTYRSHKAYTCKGLIFTKPHIWAEI